MDEKVETLKVEMQHLKDENSDLRLMLEVLSSKYRTLESQLEEISNNKAEQVVISDSSSLPFIDTTTNKRPRLEFPTVAKKPLQIFVRTNPKDDSLIIKDGYQWRKYGQKVTKDNASPRAYFRCSMAPSCPAKKKVQRCIHDKSILVATYDGEHNHNALHESLLPSSSTPKGSIMTNNNSHLPMTPNDKLQEAMMTINHDALFGWSKKDETFCDNVIMQKISDHRGSTKIEECAISLIKDPEFTAALAEAVARTITGQHNNKEQGLNLNLGLPEE